MVLPAKATRRLSRIGLDSSRRRSYRSCDTQDQHGAGIVPGPGVLTLAPACDLLPELRKR
jgi:hypothetical protein